MQQRVLRPDAEDTAALWNFWAPFQWTSPYFIVFRESRQEGQASQVSFACYFCICELISVTQAVNNANLRQEAAPLCQVQEKAMCVLSMLYCTCILNVSNQLDVS